MANLHEENLVHGRSVARVILEGPCKLGSALNIINMDTPFRIKQLARRLVRHLHHYLFVCSHLKSDQHPLPLFSIAVYAFSSSNGQEGECNDMALRLTSDEQESSRLVGVIVSRLFD
jgi:hypothetical protein